MHVIAVTVGISILEKTLREIMLYNSLLGSEENDMPGKLQQCNIERLEQGQGFLDQLETEHECFRHSKGPGSIPDEIRKGKRNRLSAEVCSLHAILADKQLTSTDCRIALLATDSAESVFAARLNKRVIAHRMFAVDEDLVMQWKVEGDNGLHHAFAQIPIIRILGLQVEDADRFANEGLKNLRTAVEDLEGYWRGGKQRIFNITGGFKGVIPAVVAIAWSSGWEIAYLYEETKKYITIPRTGADFEIIVRPATESFWDDTPLGNFHP